jgi:hypothetical protein|nr:MAG TPA: hypothetical protein [Caudoviricetes sp.]
MANRDFLFETKTQDFYKVQANILTEDITNNNFMPEDPRISKNKGLNTTKKNIVGAINEAFDMAHEAYVKNSGTAFVKTVNGIVPNGVGNVDIKNVDRSVGDALGRKIHETYITLNDLPKITKAAARSVNGVVPDSNGDVRLKIVSTINSLSPDRNGNVEINLDDFVTKNELFEEIGDAIKKIPKQKAITVNGVPPDLDNNIVLRRVPESTKATRDGDDNIIADTYITKEKLDKAVDDLSATVVHSINGRTPNVDGTFTLDSVPKDGAGNVITATYARKEDVYLKAQVDNKIAEAHSGISTPEQLAENVAFKNKYAAREDVYTKTQTDEKITEAINALPNAETLSLNPAFTDKYVNKTAVYTKEEANQKIADAVSTVDAETLSQNTAFTSKYATKVELNDFKASITLQENECKTLKEKLQEINDEINKLKEKVDLLSKNQGKNPPSPPSTQGGVIKLWVARSTYVLNDLVKNGTHIYKVTGVTPRVLENTGKTGKKAPSLKNIAVGSVIEDGTMKAKYIGKLRGQLAINTEYLKDEYIIWESQVLICDVPGTTNDKTNVSWDANKDGLTSGTAHFKIVYKTKVVWWGADKLYKDGQICIHNGRILEYEAKGSISVDEAGDNAPTFTEGTQKNGDYEFTYVKKDEEEDEG